MIDNSSGGEEFWFEVLANFHGVGYSHHGQFQPSRHLPTPHPRQMVTHIVLSIWHALTYKTSQQHSCVWSPVIIPTL